MGLCLAERATERPQRPLRSRSQRRNNPKNSFRPDMHFFLDNIQNFCYSIDLNLFNVLKISLK